MRLRYRKTDVYAHNLVAPANGNAGYDLSACEDVLLDTGVWTKVNTGIAVEIPNGYVGFVKGRSGLAFNNNIIVFEGTVDSNYRGEIKVLMLYTADKYSSDIYQIREGNRIAQLVIVPCYTEPTELVEELTNTSRGKLGFGSSGV